MPFVSVEAMRQAYFPRCRAKYMPSYISPRPPTGGFQLTTPNASTHYVYFNFNLKDGVIILEIHPTVGAGLFGSLDNAWKVPVTDVGMASQNKRRGGRYLLLPPGYKATIPAHIFRFNSQIQIPQQVSFWHSNPLASAKLPVTGHPESSSTSPGNQKQAAHTIKSECPHPAP
jgi:hypothetical protein